MSIIWYTPSNSEEKEIKLYNHATCQYCEKDVTIGKNSIILGDKWYHMECFIVEEMVENGT